MIQLHSKIFTPGPRRTGRRHASLMITATRGWSAIATPTGGTSTGASAWSRWWTARRTGSPTVSSQETKVGGPHMCLTPRHHQGQEILNDQQKQLMDLISSDFEFCPYF